MTRPYSRYRDSGVEWLGDVPSHWEVRRLKHSVLRSDEKVGVEDADGVPYVGLEHVISWMGSLLPLEEQQTPESTSNWFAAGDVLFGKLRPYLAKTFCAGFDGLCSTEFLVLKPFAYEQQYLLYLMLADGFVSLVDSATFGAKMPRANWNFVCSCGLPLPPLDEQRDIAAYLDRETGRIDALVEKKRLLLERLAEYRTALITRTVTRGLDASVAMKDSGVEWLGEVPSHWEVTRLLRVMQLKAGDGITSDEIDDVGEYPVFGGNGVRGFTNRYTHEGDFVLIGRQGALCGNINLARGKFWASEHAVVADALEAVSVSWLARVLAAMKLTQYSAAAAQPGLAIDRIKGLHVPLPPLDEQRTIAAFLDRETARLDGLSAQVETASERLQEYRTALITAAVTGKIDVRQSPREHAAAK